MLKLHSDFFNNARKHTTCERSFSTLKLIKKNLNSTMGQEFGNSVNRIRVAKEIDKRSEKQ